MSLLLGTKNFASQTVEANEIVSLGSVYRRYCKRVNGLRTFDFDSTEVILQSTGVYHITATAVASATASGNVTLSLYENGLAIPGAFSTETITTPTTELRTFTIDYYVLVDSTCVLGCNSVVNKSISLVNTGVEAVYSSVVLNVEKVL